MENNRISLERVKKFNLKEKKMTKEQAIKLSESEFWKKMTFRQIAEFQLFEPLLCVPFEIFHEAMEKTLNRPIFTHEL